MANVVKKRNWVFILYPESAPENWLDMLNTSGLCGAVSPLHDKDVDDASNPVPKKAHYHVIACWDGPTTFKVVKNFVDQFNAPIPKPCESIRGSYRYFTHKDNPDKYQYDEKDIITFGGFDIRDFVDFTKSETTALIKSVLHFIREKDIVEYSDLLDILDDNDLHDMFSIASTHTMVISKYLESRRWKREMETP